MLNFIIKNLTAQGIRPSKKNKISQNMTPQVWYHGESIFAGSDTKVSQSIWQSDTTVSQSLQCLILRWANLPGVGYPSES